MQPAQVYLRPTASPVRAYIMRSLEVPQPVPCTVKASVLLSTTLMLNSAERASLPAKNARTPRPVHPAKLASSSTQQPALLLVRLRGTILTQAFRPAKSAQT